ncbi:hypothetical protein RFI_19519, partial [Reticulomyxa filosa]
MKTIDDNESNENEDDESTEEKEASDDEEKTATKDAKKDKTFRNGKTTAKHAKDTVGRTQPHNENGKNVGKQKTTKTGTNTNTNKSANNNSKKNKQKSPSKAKVVPKANESVKITSKLTQSKRPLPRALSANASSVSATLKQRVPSKNADKQSKSVFLLLTFSI